MLLDNWIGRVLAVGLSLSGLLTAAPALAQTADVALALDEKAPARIVLGGTESYTYKVTNIGPSSAQGVALTITVPSTATIAAATGCTLGKPATATPDTYPCEIGEISDISGSNVVNITFSVNYTIPKELPTTCPAATDTLGPITVAVATETTDPNAANNAPITLNTQVDAWTDLGVAVSAQSAASVGDDIAYEVTVVNNGPCPATRVVVKDKLGATNTSLEFQSSAGDCTADPFAEGCKWETLAAGESKRFVSTYKGGPQPASLTQTKLVLSLNVSADQKDLVSKNDASAAGPVVKISTGGCSSAGMGEPFGLLGVVALLGRRRRAR